MTIITSSKYPDYKIEFNAEGLVSTNLLNQLLNEKVEEFLSNDDLKEVLNTNNTHPYFNWFKTYLNVATKLKKDSVLPDLAYWKSNTYQPISKNNTDDVSWKWIKLTVSDILNIDEFVAMDVETTGLSNDDSIIQLSAVKFKNGEIVDEFDQFIYPSNGKSISQEITDITGISQSDVDGKPLFKDVLQSFLDFVGELPWCGHNITFDINKFKSEMERINVDMMNLTTLDTLSLTKKIYPFWPSRNGAYKLENIKHRLDENLIKNLKSHNSLDDSKMCGWWLLELQKEVDRRG